jgi:hypothetical protein
VSRKLEGEERRDGEKGNENETKRKRTLVERVIGVRFEEQVLQSDHDGVEVENGFPVFAKDVQAHVALEVEVRVVDLVRARSGRVRLGTRTRTRGGGRSGRKWDWIGTDLGHALDFWRVVGVVGIDDEGEKELAALVHACEREEERQEWSVAFVPHPFAVS